MSPSKLIARPINKNLNPLAIRDAKINIKILKPKKPLAIVINLNGKGVNPAPRTSHIPKSW